MMGCEWVVEAYGCEPEALTDQSRLEAVFDRMVAELSLTPAAPAVWHRFPGAGGVTGVLLLQESHLACHTFPEHQSLCLNLFCCRERAEWPFDGRLREMLGAERVEVRRLVRDYAPQSTGAAR